MEFLAQLDDLAVLRITGDDAADFLHAQLSNDISALKSDESRLAAYCTPKGRMLGSLLLWRETAEADSALLALVKADLAEALLKRLRMFVLRAKVVFELTPLKVQGLSLAAGSATAQALGLEGAAPWQLKRKGSQAFICAPSSAEGLQRWWRVDTQADDTAPQAAVPELALMEAAAWQAQDIEAGLGWVEQANQELFIPQSLNYDLNGGVNFTKGCYPGQEVVARAHYRGAVKRRGMAGQCSLSDDAALQAGADIFDAKRPDSPAGRIINAARLPDTQAESNSWRVFMEISLADVGQADFRAVSAEGPAITLLPLPYSLEPDSGS